MANDLVVTIKVPSRTYEARVGAGNLERLGAAVRSLLPTARRAFVVRDAGVPAQFGSLAWDSLTTAGFDLAEFAINPSERAKALTTLESLDRKSVV